MNNDLISRSALLAKRCKLTGLIDEAGMKHAATAIPVDVVKTAPAIDPEDLRPHGRWIGKNSPYDVNIHICSVCREQVSILGNKLRFCPNCGAKMDKEEDHA